MTDLVLDASAGVDIAINSRRGRRVTARAKQIGGRAYAPEHFFAETAHVLSKRSMNGPLSADRAWAGFETLERLVLAVSLSGHTWLAWQWRHLGSPYDMLYVAVAKRMSAQLLTCDGAQADAAQLLGVDVVLVR